MAKHPNDELNEQLENPPSHNGLSQDQNNRLDAADTPYEAQQQEREKAQYGANTDLESDDPEFQGAPRPR